MGPRFHRTLRILLSQWQKAALRFMEDVFQRVIRVSLVSGYPGGFWQIKVIPLHGTRIAVAAWGQEEFNRLSVFGNHQMQLQAVKETPFARLFASPHLSLISLGTENAVVVAGRYRKAVNHVNRAFIQRFPGLTQHVEQGQE